MNLNSRFFLILIITLISNWGCDKSKSKIKNMPVPSIPIDNGSERYSKTVWLEWNAPVINSNLVKAYYLQVGTSKDKSDVFDGIIGNTLKYDITASDGQTIYARVAAVGIDGKLSDWSLWSDGITIHDPLLLPATLFVAPPPLGDDNNVGTKESPFRTISKAISKASAGAIVEVAGGTYSENVNIDKGGTFKKPIVIRAKLDQEVNLEGSSSTPFTGNWRDDGLRNTGEESCSLWSAPFNPEKYPGLIYQTNRLTPVQLFIDGETRLELIPKPISYANGYALSVEETQDIDENWIDNERLINKQLAPNRWFWLDDSHSENFRNRVFVCLGVEELAANHNIEIPLYNYAFNISKSHVQVSGFNIRKYGVLGIIARSSEWIEDVIITNNSVRFSSAARETRSADRPEIPFVWADGFGIIAHVNEKTLIRNNTVEDVSYKAIHVGSPDQNTPIYFRIDDNIINKVNPHPFGVNNAHEGGQGIGSGNCNTHIFISNNKVNDVNQGIWFDSSLNVGCGVGYIFLDNNEISNVGNGILLERAIKNSVANNNLIINSYNAFKFGTHSQYSQELDKDNPIFSSSNHAIFNNTIINAKIAFNLSYSHNISIFNNLITTTNDFGHDMVLAVFISASTVLLKNKLNFSYGYINNNLYYLDNVTPNAIGCFDTLTLEDCYQVLSEWVSSTNESFDSHSILTDPFLKDPENHDFSLLESSPALGSGVDYYLIKGKSVNIGAF